jgi:transcription elongation GreA/GreB family factor
MGLNKQALLAQLLERLQLTDRQAVRAEADARDAAAHLATESEKREDGRAALEYGSMANAQANRARRLKQELTALSALVAGPLPRFGHRSAVDIGAIVDVAVEDDEGTAERTYFVLPAGAGHELTGPGGDGYLSVITPASPVGQALMGRRAGDSVDVVYGGAVRAWTVLEVG